MRPHRSGWLAAACLVALGACTSDGGPPAGGTTGGTTGDGTLGAPMAESVILTSADGVVRLEVPAGSVREGTDLGIDLVDPAETATAVGAAPIGPGYALRPAGLTFVEPVAVTLTVPLEATGRVDEAPVMFTVVAGGDAIEPASEGRSSIEDGDVVHLSSIDRFGVLVLLDGGVTLGLDPPRVDELRLDDSFDATATARAEPGSVEPRPGNDLQLRWLGSGALTDPSDSLESFSGLGATGGEQEWRLVQEYACDEVGGGSYGVEIRVDVGGLPNDAQTVQFVQLVGESACGDVGRQP